MVRTCRPEEDIKEPFHAFIFLRCQHKQSCYVVSTNEEFGDPCYGTYKYLKIKYACIPEESEDTD